jgi:FkbH-like protein
MTADITDFAPLDIARITQLTNKSNQFNLTSKRYTEAEMLRAAENPNYIRLCGRLSDKFGDNGIVSVVTGEIRDKILHIDLWLMSCRVLKRGMEYAMLDTLVQTCREKGVTEIAGYYFPTAKNAMVKDLFKEFGFEHTSENEQGTVWKLDIKDFTKQNKHITVRR